MWVSILHQALEASERQAVKLDQLLSTAIQRGDDFKASLDEATAQCREKSRSDKKPQKSIIPSHLLNQHPCWCFFHPRSWQAAEEEIVRVKSISEGLEASLSRATGESDVSLVSMTESLVG